MREAPTTGAAVLVCLAEGTAVAIAQGPMAGAAFDRYRIERAQPPEQGGWAAGDPGRPRGKCRYKSHTRSEAGAVASVGSRGDSYDNALAESFHGLYKTELIRHHGPWRGLDDVEYATLEYVDWFNHRRLHGEPGMVPPRSSRPRRPRLTSAGKRKGPPKRASKLYQAGAGA